MTVDWGIIPASLLTVNGETMDRIIEKTKENQKGAWIQDYDTFASSFRWKVVQEEMTGLPDGNGLNICYEAVDRHLGASATFGDISTKVAIRWCGKDGSMRDFTYDIHRQHKSHRRFNQLDLWHQPFCGRS